MSKRSLWDGRDYGRNDFDTRAGYEWAHGPSSNDISIVTPDVPWRDYKPGNKILWDNNVWAVTSFGLEALRSFKGNRYDEYVISAVGLLSWRIEGSTYFWPIEIAEDSSLYFEKFAEAFERAVELHLCDVDVVALDTTLRRARGMLRRAKRSRLVSRGSSVPYRAKGGFVIKCGWAR